MGLRRSAKVRSETARQFSRAAKQACCQALSPLPDSLIPTKEANESKHAAEVGGEVTTGNSDINLTIHHSVLSKALGCEIPPATQPRLPFFVFVDNSRIKHSVLITVNTRV